jgi:hypothetical protein
VNPNIETSLFSVISIFGEFYFVGNLLIYSAWKLTQFSDIFYQARWLRMDFKIYACLVRLLTPVILIGRRKNLKPHNIIHKKLGTTPLKSFNAAQSYIFLNTFHNQSPWI